jgi:hypothetical protein
MWVVCSCLLQRSYTASAYLPNLFLPTNTTVLQAHSVPSASFTNMSKRSVESPSPPPETKRPKVCDEILNETIYEPLPPGEFIRVLSLQPGEADEDIECSLEVVDIESSKESYEAISYVWGDPNDTADVQCNGRRVPITVSLADALRIFRSTSEPRLLWADALCINQKDDQEKGHQVKRMGEVYTNAERVLVWLGRDDENVAEDTFALIREANVYFADSFLQADQDLLKMVPFTKPYPICMDKERWSRVAELCLLPWFNRVWTVQEIAVAKEGCLFWGSISIGIADVLETCLWTYTKSDFGGILESLLGYTMGKLGNNIYLYRHYNTQRPEPWQRSRAGMTYFAAFYKDRTFSQVLNDARFLEASNPRDRVYAFLGCPAAKDSHGRTLVEADYTSSMYDLNIQLAYTLIEHPVERSLVFSNIFHDDRQSLLGGMHPSWVPLWHVAPTHRVRIANTSHWFKAGGTGELFAAASSGKSCVTVSARTIDSVIWRSKKIWSRGKLHTTDGAKNKLNAEYIDTLWDGVMQGSSQFGIAVRKVDYWRTLMRGYPLERGSHMISDELQQRTVDAHRKSISVARPSGLEAGVMTVDEQRHASYFNIGLDLVHNASIFITEMGRIGLAPLGDLVEVGDVCCIIFGASVPFLLTQAKEGRHKFISECYINGVMDGEMMQQFAGSELKEHRIVLE